LIRLGAARTTPTAPILLTPEQMLAANETATTTMEAKK